MKRPYFSATTCRLAVGIAFISLVASLGAVATPVINWANVAITGGTITGITDLAVADGGTGVSTITGIVKGNGASAFSAASGGTDYYAPSGTDVAVADGGTGASTLTGLVVGNGTSPFTTVSYAEGTWSPSCTAVANCDANPTASTSYYLQVGNSVTCWGTVTVDATTTNTYTTFRMTIPIASALTAAEQMGGDAGFKGSIAERDFAISADGTNDQAFFESVLVNANSKSYAFLLTYKVL